MFKMGRERRRWRGSLVALQGVGQGGETLLPCSRVNLVAFERRRGEPLANGEVHAQSPMKWAFDAFGEPCEPVNLRRQKSAKCNSAMLAQKNKR
jgi:hypothetical protein